MSARISPVVFAAVTLLVVAACGASATPITRPTPAGPTPVPATEPATRPQPPVTPAPDSGNVGGRTGPELTIELVDPETIAVALRDPAAKAWRLVVAGVGEREGDRWEILVETGDVAPSIVATEIRDGRVVDEMSLSGFADGTAAAGGCHGTLPVCLSSDGFRLPQDGDGTFSVRLVLPEPGTPLAITGATAGWPGEPFVLGPWTDTATFPWGTGA